MKRILTVTLLILLTLVSSSVFAATTKDYNSEGRTNTGSFHIKCYKCASEAKERRGYGMCMGCPAWRMYEYSKVVDGEKCMVYHCQHGHKLYVSVESTKRM